MAVGIFVPVVLWNYADRFVWAYLSGAAIIVAFGMADDSRDLRPKWKLVGQLAAALVVVGFRRGPDPHAREPAPGGHADPGLVRRPLHRAGDHGRDQRDQPLRRAGRPGGRDLPAHLLLHRVPRVPAGGFRAGADRAGHRGRHLRLPAVQHVPGHGLHGGHGEPAPGVHGDHAVARSDPGEHPLEPHPSPDPARVPDPGHAVGDGGPDRRRPLPVPGGPEPFPPQPAGAGVPDDRIRDGDLRVPVAPGAVGLPVPFPLGRAPAGRLPGVFRPRHRSLHGGGPKRVAVEGARPPSCATSSAPRTCAG